MEIKDKILDPHFPQCPVRNVIARIGDRWSILIMLTRTLRDLEADGFVSRIAYAEVPPRVEYQLTPRARTLTPLLNDLVQWAASNLSAIVKDRQNYYLPKS